MSRLTNIGALNSTNVAYDDLNKEINFGADDVRDVNVFKRTSTAKKIF